MPTSDSMLLLPTASETSLPARLECRGLPHLQVGTWRLREAVWFSQGGEGNRFPIHESAVSRAHHGPVYHSLGPMGPPGSICPAWTLGPWEEGSPDTSQMLGIGSSSLRGTAGPSRSVLQQTAQGRGIAAGSQEYVRLQRPAGQSHYSPFVHSDTPTWRHTDAPLGSWLISSKSGG